MPSTREIRRRIRSVKNISQVTRAMQMVAASKMRRAQEQVLATRPYTEKAWQILSNLSAQRGVDESASPAAGPGGDPGHRHVLVTRQGLCGSYNHNMIQHGRYMAELSYPVELSPSASGARCHVAPATDHRRRILRPASARLLDITPITRTVMDGFISGRYDVVYLAHTDFINTLTQRPAIWQFCPSGPCTWASPVSEYRGSDPRPSNTSTSPTRTPSWTPSCPVSPSCRSTRLFGSWPASTAPVWWPCAMPPRMRSSSWTT